MTLSSSACRKNWWNAYGDVMAASSQIVPPSVLPNLLPSALVSSGVARAWTRSPDARRINSTPAVMLPH